MKRLLRWMFHGQRQHIRHLESEVAFWREQYTHERKRAEDAIDQWRILLAAKHAAPVPVGPLAPPPPPQAERDLQRDLAELIHNRDYQDVGAVPGDLHG